MLMVDEVQSEGGIDEHEGELIRIGHRVQRPGGGGHPDAPGARGGGGGAATRWKRSRTGIRLHSGYLPAAGVPAIPSTTLLGVIHEKDFYDPDNQRAASGNLMQPVIQEVPCVPTGMQISAICCGSCSGTKNASWPWWWTSSAAPWGIVTMEDILEELVGEIWDEHDDVVEDIRPLPDGGFCVKGDVRLDDMLEFFHIDKEYDVVSVGGWAQQELGAVPQTGDRFEAEGLEVTITATEMRRVTEILVRPAADEPREERP